MGSCASMQMMDISATVGNFCKKSDAEFSLVGFPLSDKCTVFGEIGNGAFSKVFRVELQGTGIAALKIISKNRCINTCIVNEIDIMKLLHHEHIVQLYQNCEDDLNIYLLLEMICGGELFDRIVKKSTYTEREARQIMKTLINVAQYMKSIGVIHRDIKPENLMHATLEDDSNIKLIDFGFAIKENEIKADSTPCGTPAYVSPEILERRIYGCETDVWSLGVIFYILLAGYAPFYDEDQGELFAAIVAGDYIFHPEHWGQVSDQAKDFVTRMLTVNQTDRWTPDMLAGHEWMRMEDEDLEKIDIAKSLVELKKFNIKRKFRARVNAIVAINRIRKVSPEVVIIE